MAETKRQRGAQPGNDNARKHGRYAADALRERARRYELYRGFRDVVKAFEELVMEDKLVIK